VQQTAMITNNDSITNGQPFNESTTNGHNTVTNGQPLNDSMMNGHNTVTNGQLFNECMTNEHNTVTNGQPFNESMKNEKLYSGRMRNEKPYRKLIKYTEETKVHKQHSCVIFIYD